MASLLLRSLLDLCFPPRCVACGDGGWAMGTEGLCHTCARSLPPPVRRCSACGRRVGPYRVDPGCAGCCGTFAEADALSWSGKPRARRRRAIRGVVAAWSYGGTPRALVIALKFRGRMEAARSLASGLCEALIRARVPGDLVVPVPLSPRRRRERGYNQATLLARQVASSLGLDFRARALKRRVHTAPQSGLARSARRRAQRGAFLARPHQVRGRCVILVDDVLTSGATARACALALRRAGALAVTVAVACRAERTRGP